MGTYVAQPSYFVIDGAEIVSHNFRGAKTAFSDEGDRHIIVALADEAAVAFSEHNWEVLRFPKPFLKVGIRFPLNGRESSTWPGITLNTGTRLRSVDEATIGLLDDFVPKTAMLTVQGEATANGGIQAVLTQGDFFLEMLPEGSQERMICLQEAADWVLREIEVPVKLSDEFHHSVHGVWKNGYLAGLEHVGKHFRHQVTALDFQYKTHHRLEDDLTRAFEQAHKKEKPNGR